MTIGQSLSSQNDGNLDRFNCCTVYISLHVEINIFENKNRPQGRNLGYIYVKCVQVMSRFMSEISFSVCRKTLIKQGIITPKAKNSG